MEQYEDVRHKAAAILSGRKLQMLEAEGLVVVERRRLEALERVAGWVKMWRKQMVDKAGFSQGPEDRQRVHERNLMLAVNLRESVDELEAMEK